MTDQTRPQGRSSEDGPSGTAALPGDGADDDGAPGGAAQPSAVQSPEPQSDPPAPPDPPTPPDPPAQPAATPGNTTVTTGGTPGPAKPKRRKGEAEPPVVVKVTSWDLFWIALIALCVVGLIGAFGWLVQANGFLDFPGIAESETRGGPDRYFQDALDYRERRLTLALTYRTFTAGLGLVVGLALATQGGVFILRQVTAFTALSGNNGQPGEGEGGAPARWAFRFESYSPGVVFLLGGVAVIWVTQSHAIPIRWIEVVPPSAMQLCYHEDRNEWRNCMLPVSNATPSENSETFTLDRILGE